MIDSRHLSGRTASNYQHVQRAPLCLLLYALAALFFVLPWAVPNLPPGEWLYLLVGVGMLILATSMHYLMVEDQGDVLEIGFGPFPLFRRAIRYDEIEGFERGRTTVLDGWGIHLSLRGGWVWNLWGRDCVLLRLRSGRLRVGTDDPEDFIRFLESRVGSVAAVPEVAGNLLAEVPANLSEEGIEALVTQGAVRIERIVSTGHRSPDDFWYDQTEHEWLLVLRGEAWLRFADASDAVRLGPGDYRWIPAHQKHRVEATSSTEPTVWLAVFWKG